MELTIGSLKDHTPNKQKQPIQFTPTKDNQKLCRICLQQLQDSQIPELCLCKGQNSYIHQKCLLEWVKRADKYEQFPYTYFYLCDLCKTRIYLDTQIKWSCKKWENMTFCGRSSCCTIASVFVLVIGLVLIIQGGILLESSDLKELVWFGLVAGCIVISLGILFYSFQVLLDMEIVINGLAKKIVKKAKRNQVMPSNPEIYAISFDSTNKFPHGSQDSNNHLRDYQH